MTSSNSRETPSRQQSHFDRIPTEKSAVKRAVDKPVSPPSLEDDATTQREKNEARDRQRLDRERQIKRYQVASMAYIGAMLRDPNAVSVVWEQVIFKWLEGKLSGYDETKSFRNYLKTVLRNEVFAYGRGQKREREVGPRRMDSTYDQPDALEATASIAFDRKLQDTVVDRALLAVQQEDTLYHETLRILMQAVASEQKSPKSRQLAAMLSEIGGTTVSEDNARQIKKRARQMFSRKIIDQVGEFINSSNLEKIEKALRDWNLIAYCEKALSEMKK